MGQLLLRHSQEVAESREWLVEQLKAAQASHTKGGRLDEALEIRKTVDAMTAENVTNQLVPMVTKLRAKLPSDAVRAVDHFLQTVANSQSEMSESQKVLDKQLMKPTEAAAQKALLGPDLNAARQAVAAVYTLKREFPAFLHSGRRQPLTLSPQTSEILAELTEGNVKRRAKLEELEAPLRKTLLEKLGKLQESNLKAEEELAIRRTIETLSLSNFSGLRGYLLFFIDSELQGESAEVVKKYWQEMEAHIDSARTELAAAHKVLKPRLEAALKTQVEANDWGAALATAEQIQSPPRFFEPFAVKTNSGGGGGSSHFPWNGSVIDVRDGAYLVINMHQHEEWMTRDRLRLGSETVPELKPRRPGDFYAVPPSFAVTTKTLLKPGRIVLFQEHTRWNLGEIKEVRSNDVVVKSLGFGFSRDSEVQKSGLRTLVPMEP